MSKNLFLAPAANGKTTYALKLARKTAESLHAEVRVCVPTGLQARAWRQRLAAAGGAIGVHVLTFDRLVATCLDAAGEAYTELSEAVQYRLLRMIIEQLPLHHYAPLKARPGFIQVTWQFITELKSARVDPLDFAAAVKQLGNEPRLSELADIYTAYQAHLQAQDWADRVGLHWLVVEALEERAPQACQDWPLLIVDGFDDFTPAQLALLRVLADRIGRFVITLPQSEQVDYPRYQATQQEVESALAVTGQPLPAPDKPPSSHPTLHHLAQQLFVRSSNEPVSNEEANLEEAITLREAPDRAAEARTALRWLKQQIVWEGLSPDEVALLARDITPYRAFIQQIASEFGLPIRLVDGQPLQQNPAIATLLALLRLHLPVSVGHGPNLPRRQVIAAWRSPYFFWENETVAITAADADALDNFARQQRVIRGQPQWEAAFAAGLKARDDLDYDDENEGGSQLLTGPAVQQLQDKFTYFLALTEPSAEATTMRDFVQWLETVIGPDPQAPGDASPPTSSLHIVAQARRNPATAVADVAALRTLKDILRGLVWAEEAVEQSRPVDFSTFFSELSGAIAGAQFMLPARADQPEIIIANVTQARGLRFAAAAVMGLSEGSFPATISEDPFLRDADRWAMRQGFNFPLELSTLSAEREFFYEAVSRADQRVLLTRPVLADNGAEWVASPFWEATSRLVDTAVEAIPSEGVIAIAETASWPEWWESVAAHPDGAAWGRRQNPDIWRQIQSAARIWQIREAAERAVWDGDLSLLESELFSLYGPDHIWSASRLESYQTCGFLFFLQNSLKLAPRPEPAEGLDARQLGSLYHDIFEQVTTLGLPDPPDKDVLRELVTALATPILDAAPEREGFRETPWWSQTRQEILDNITKSVLELSGGAYTLLQTEASFGINDPPLVIRHGEDQLRLRGFIDRIDRRADGSIRIVDYKLGGKTAFSKAAFSKGKKLQLPLYALAAQETLGLGLVVDGFYWHFRAAEASPFTLGMADGGVKGAMETAVAHAWEAVHRIRSGQFTPQPPTEGCPTYCPAAGFCWHYSPRSW